MIANLNYDKVYGDKKLWKDKNNYFSWINFKP